jgi:hypothetical protein
MIPIHHIEGFRFILNPSMWWMGIMHIPLITISLYAFAITFRGGHPPIY